MNVRTIFRSILTIGRGAPSSLPGSARSFDAVMRQFNSARTAAIQKFWAATPSERPALYPHDEAFQRARNELWRLMPASISELEGKWRALAGEQFAGYPEFIVGDLKAMIAAGVL